ncbi:hypothetical protein J6590_058172 [Homalodisca vitripennis]|nr:hypothetical protein J6590_058172 [Homalodisca vitripennis]
MLFTWDTLLSELLDTELLTIEVEDTFLDTTVEEELRTLSETILEDCSAEKELSLDSTCLLPMSFSIWSKERIRMVKIKAEIGLECILSALQIAAPEISTASPQAGRCPGLSFDISPLAPLQYFHFIVASIVKA